MVDERYLGGPGDVSVSTSGESTLQEWSSWAQSTKGHGCHLIAQLYVSGHACKSVNT